LLDITRHIRIPDTEFSWSFARSGGPGGQNVNKVASKAVLRWNVVQSPSLPEEVKARFVAAQKWRITTEGELVLASQRYRDQERNRQDCLEKLAELVRRATIKPKPRRPTKPSRGSRENRLKTKKRRSQVKSLRRTPHGE
jgi:ribosome-associated protein